MSDTFKVSMSEAIAAFEATPLSTLAKQTFRPWDLDGEAVTHGDMIRIEEAPAWQAGHAGMPTDRDVWVYVYDYHADENFSLLRGRYDGQFREFEPTGTKGSLTTSVLAWIDTEEQPAFGIEAVLACIASLEPLDDD